MVLLLKNLIFVLVVPGTVAVWGPLWLARGREIAPGLWLTAGTALLACGASVFVWCLWDFMTFGRGTPAPIDPPKRLVVRGLYRYTRNPMYLGILAVVLGWAALYASWAIALYALVLGCAFHLLILVYEEPHLGGLFGEEYRDYSARVGRWLPVRRSAGRSPLA